MFYVYAPIFAVTSGLAAEAGGIVASIGTGWIWLVPFWGWVGNRGMDDRARSAVIEDTGDSCA
jgi:hypothetical protein